MITRKRVWKVLFWGMFFLLSCLGGVVGFAYWYVTDSATVATLIRSGSKRYLPTSEVSLDHAKLRPFLGEVILRYLQVNQRLDGRSVPTLRLPLTQIQYDPHAMLKGEVDVHRVVVAKPTLRLYQRKDGTWNLKGLLADPWPGPVMKTPPISINNGVVELVGDSGDGTRPDPTLLRDVMLTIEPVPGEGKQVKFDGTARGDSFSRLALSGTVDLDTGVLTFKSGDIDRLTISESLRSRIPADYRSLVDQVGLTGGEVDLRVASLTYDKNATPPIQYDVGVQVRSGVWNCPHLPFPINDLAVWLTARDGVIHVEQAVGVNGPTRVSVEDSRFVLGDFRTTPFNLNLQVKELEIDDRLHAKTPVEFLPVWKDFLPSGRVDAGVRLARDREGGEVDVRWAVDCRDVAMNYRFFKYPLDHIWGSLVCERNQIRVNLQTLVGGKPLKATGTIDNPGDYAHVELDFEGKALPIDKALFDALPPDVRKVVDEFHPTGTVAGKAHLTRTRTRPEEPPEGKVDVHAWLSLNEHCAIKWDGLPYPVSNLTGRLELHPDEWIFTDMHGSNGQAEITGSGRVVKLPQGSVPHTGPGDPLAVDLRMRAEKLPFNDQLRDALPPAWRKSWQTLNPYGSSNVEATIRVRPGEPDSYHLVIDPQPETSVQLKFGPPAQPGARDTSGMFELRMDKVKGRFIFDNGVVNMNDVGFYFYGSPVEFARGRVVVKDSGEFDLGVERVVVDKLRLDQDDLVTIMPPVMREFARHLDPGRPISRMTGNLGLSWSGKPGESVHCKWDNVLVVLNDNKILAGVPLEHMQGQLDHVSGWFDGHQLDVRGAMKLNSVNLMGQQLTELESPFKVGKGRAELSNIRGKLLDGLVSGRFEISLDTTPQYYAVVDVDRADLKRYAETVTGRQSYRGLLSGHLELNGMGNDLRTLQGEGGARVEDGNLGELPFMLSLINQLQPKFKGAKAKTLFDSADVTVSIRNGESSLNPIKLKGNVISFLGRGRMDVQGNLDLTLSPLAGRDRLHVPVLSDALREASDQLLVVRARGQITDPNITIGPLPVLSDTIRSMSIGNRRSAADRALQ